MTKAEDIIMKLGEAVNVHEGHKTFSDEYLKTDSKTELIARLDSGYVEFPEYQESTKGYFCGTCEYFKNNWCTKLKIEDRAWGCCNKWEHK